VPSITDLGSIFKTLREVDLRPIREEAERQTWVAIVGDEGSGAQDLGVMFYLAPRPLPPDDASRMMAGPLIASLARATLIDRAELVILVLAEGRAITAGEETAVNRWAGEGKKVIVVQNTVQPSGPPLSLSEWSDTRVLQGLVTHPQFLEQQFVPAVLQAMPDRKMSLARNFPLFRIAVAKEIINESSMANASYSFSTGLAEIVPALNIPFNVADMLVLTKAQAFLVYKLGLVFGLSGRWQDHLTAFGSTIGLGFVWRTLARQLVGLIPGFGIIPKVAIAYAGTFAIGRGALQWYETGRQVQRGDLERFFREAFERGRALAANIASRAPKPTRPRFSFGRRRQVPKQLPAGDMLEP
jgi:uncharacterized protein (DUF697 family)